MIDDDLAGFLLKPPAGEVPFAVGIGPARPVERLTESFEFASRTLATMRAFDMIGVCDFDALGALPAIVADRAVGDALVGRYLEPLAASQAEIAASLRAFFESDMHVDRAAEQLFVHPNTLRYRIGRFEEITGANLRNPRSASKSGGRSSATRSGPVRRVPDGVTPRVGSATPPLRGGMRMASVITHEAPRHICSYCARVQVVESARETGVIE